MPVGNVSSLLFKIKTLDCRHFLLIIDGSYKAVHANRNGAAASVLADVLDGVTICQLLSSSCF